MSGREWADATPAQEQALAMAGKVAEALVLAASSLDLEGLAERLRRG